MLIYMCLSDRKNNHFLIMIRKISKIPKKTIIILIVSCASLFLILFYNQVHSLLYTLVRHNVNEMQICEKQHVNYSIKEGADWLEYPSIAPRCQNRILIMSHHRSGSSFLGLPCSINKFYTLNCFAKVICCNKVGQVITYMNHSMSLEK